MSIVTLSDIHVSFGPEVVLDKLNLQLHPGEKVGMVGVNGSGKSTILKLIIEQLRPEIGSVFIRKGLRIGYLPQEASFDGDKSVLEEMYAGMGHLFEIQQKIHNASAQMEKLHGPELKAKMKQYDHLCHEFEVAGGYSYESRIRSTLAGLEFKEDLHHAKTSALSGGQLSRLGLAKVLMLEADLLLLDEPTNHLDMQATEWLESFLCGFNGAALIISHDRCLLDKVACKIIEVRDGQAKVFSGNYSNYVRTKETLRLQEQRQHRRRAEMVERTRDFIARNKDQEGMRKTARGRKTILKRLLKENPDFLDKPTDDKTINFSFRAGESGSDLVLRCEQLGKSFGELKLFENLTFDILRGRRFGITGPNGTGKSTFLKLALGHIEPSAGSIRMGRNLNIGYLDQHGDVLEQSSSVLDEVMTANPQLSTERVRTCLGAFLFSGDDVFKLCRDLSGGQRNRLMLCKLVLSQPDVLVMDEPTNHLDIASMEALETALEQYEGTMIVVSHDRFFIDRIIDELIVLGMDELGNFCPGRAEFVHIKPVYSHYSSLVRQRREAHEAENVKRTANKKQISESVQNTKKTPEELRQFNKYSLEQIENMITETEEELAGIKERFGDAEIYKSPERLSELNNHFEQKSEYLHLLYRSYEYRAGW